MVSSQYKKEEDIFMENEKKCKTVTIFVQYTDG
jgi:hypothetical protein